MIFFLLDQLALSLVNGEKMVEVDISAKNSGLD